MKLNASCPFLHTLSLIAVLASCMLWPMRGFGQSTGGNLPAAEAPQQPGIDKDGDKNGDAGGEKNVQKSSSSSTTKIKIQVTGDKDQPIGNASVYVRFYSSGGFLRHDKLEEMNFKTNQDGSVKVPEIPRGKILVQVIAKGWHTYGKWYDVDTEEKSIPIKLDPPPHWY